MGSHASGGKRAIKQTSIPDETSGFLFRICMLLMKRSPALEWKQAGPGD